MQITRFSPIQPPSTRPAPRFGALTLEVGKPVPFVIIDGRESRQAYLKDQIAAMGALFQGWITAHQAQIDQITQGLDVKAKVVNAEEFDGCKDKATRTAYRTVRLEKMNTAKAAEIGIKFSLTQEGKVTELPFNTAGKGDNPTACRGFNSWAVEAFNNPAELYQNLTHALQQAVKNSHA